jgi:hypothetical protein
MKLIPTILVIAATGLAATMPSAELRAAEAESSGNVPPSPGPASEATPRPAAKMQTPAPDLPASTSAEPAMPLQSPDGRFALYRIDDGFVRLDRRTGEVAACSRRADGWACDAAAEERTAFDQKLERLQRDNAVLKQALLDRGLPLPDGMAGIASAAPPAAEAAPSGGALVPRPPQTVPPAASTAPKAGEADRAAREEVEIDRIMTIVDRVWRRVVDMARTMQRDLQGKE